MFPALSAPTTTVILLVLTLHPFTEVEKKDVTCSFFAVWLGLQFKLRLSFQSGNVFPAPQKPEVGTQEDEEAGVPLCLSLLFVFWRTCGFLTCFSSAVDFGIHIV